MLLDRNFDFFGGYLVVNTRYLVVTGGYCSLPSLLLVPTFSMNKQRHLNDAKVACNVFHIIRNSFIIKRNTWTGKYLRNAWFTSFSKFRTYSLISVHTWALAWTSSVVALLAWLIVHSTSNYLFLYFSWLKFILFLFGQSKAQAVARRCFKKRGVFKNFAKFTGNQWYQRLNFKEHRFLL